MSPMPSVGSGTYSPGPNMVCSPEQEKVGTGSIEAIIYPVYSDLRIRATVSFEETLPYNPPSGSVPKAISLCLPTSLEAWGGDAERRRGSEEVVRACSLLIRG